MPQFTICDDEFGDITVKPDARALRYVFRVKSGRLVVTSPAAVRERDLIAVIDEKRADIRRLWLRRRDERISVGDVIETRCFTIIINSHSGKNILYNFKDDNLCVYFPADADISDEAVQCKLKSGIMSFVRRSSEAYLKERLDKLSSALRLSYKDFSVSYGRSRLGKCDTRRNITLSCYLMFYPPQLIDYVILHELAHLTEMNHGERFHQLCNRYCGGNEKSLQRQLRSFPLPV